MKVKKISALLLLSIILGAVTAPGAASSPSGGTVYVPAYSSILHSDLKREFSLSVTLSIHNTDIKRGIVIESIDYYSTAGKLIQRFLQGKKIPLNPLETYNLGIREADDRGGIGANFLIRWSAETGAARPIIETIMIGTRGQQGISFTSRGVTVEE